MDDVQVMPCLRCGKALKSDAGKFYVCDCGSSFPSDEVDFYRAPGFYREWLAALGCACGRVDHYSDGGVAVVPHRCSGGGVMWMDSPFNGSEAN